MPPMADDDDTKWMSIALDLARHGVGRTAPNPPVGAVIVRDGVMLGSGWHHAAGLPHAEREALADARSRHGDEALVGSTVFVTLEPCSSHGRTPPCTQGLIDAKVRRVVYATVDRDPRHIGRADEILRDAGISVTSGVCADAAEALLSPFFKVRETGLPWVIWKTAMSLDGRLTRPPGEDQWLTGELARADVQILRSTIDAILTTGETVRRDLPSLTIRDFHQLEGRLQPWRVVFSNHPETLPVESAPLFNDAWKDRTLVRGGGTIAEHLRNLVREQGVLSVMTEAGGEFCAALFEENLVDEIVIYYAPLLCGGPNRALAGLGLAEPLRLLAPQFTRIGNDIRLRARIRRPHANDSCEVQKGTRPRV